jgi:hypothetical protein
VWPDSGKFCATSTHAPLVLLWLFLVYWARVRSSSPMQYRLPHLPGMLDFASNEDASGQAATAGCGTYPPVRLGLLGVCAGVSYRLRAWRVLPWACGHTWFVSVLVSCAHAAPDGGGR